MTDIYGEMVSVWALHSSKGDQATAEAVLAIFARNGIQPRQDDGYLIQITLSRRTATVNEIVIGLRYMKRDGTQTEDHFLTAPNRGLTYYNKRSLETRSPEYKGAHKQQVDQSKITAYSASTEVNTISVMYSPGKAQHGT